MLLAAPFLKARWALAYARTAYQEYFRHRQWSIGLAQAPIHRFLEPDFRPRVEWIQAPGHDEYLADPFGVVHAGRLHALCEKFDRRTQRGSLQAFPWPGAGGKPHLQSVLPLPVHASYPCLIEQDGNVYCIPETCLAGEVTLYKADAFPARWSKVATLLTGFPGVDSTVVPFDGHWWLFCTEATAPDRRLFVWHAERLEGPWQPHAKNPVLDSPMSARPAGTPFAWNGTLYRPAQDCSETYGGRVAINQVDVLSPEAYREHVVSFVGPDPDGPYPLGLHTLSSAGGRTLLDGFRNVFSPSAFQQRLGRPPSARQSTVAKS